MDYEKAYKEALELMKGCIPDGNGFVNIRPCDIFPELKESEDERIRQRIIHALHGDVLEMSEIKEAIAWLKKQGDKDKLIEELGEYKAKYIQEVLQKHLEEQKPAWSEEGEKIRKALIDFVQQYGDDFYSQVSKGRAIAWLEKQGTPAKLSEEEQNRFAKGILTSCAMSFIDYLDAHKYEGKMCVSNGECEDIENAFHNAMWDKLHRYYGKYIEKQGKENPLKGTLGDVFDDLKFGLDPSPKQGEKEQDPCENCEDVMLNCHNFPCIKKRAFEQGKSILEVINEEKVDNVNKVEPKDYNDIDPHFGKPADKIEPKFKED